MGMYIYDDNEEELWEDLYERAKERLQEARLALIAAEAAMPKIEQELAWIGLKKQGIRFGHQGEKVFVNWSNAPNSPCIFIGVEKGKILLKQISKTGKVLKTVREVSHSSAKCIKLAP